MSELKKLLKAREKLVAQREWAKAGAKFYESVQLTAQVSIRDIDQAVEKIRAEAARSSEIAKTARVARNDKATAEQKKVAKGDIPATGEAFWLSFLDHDGRRQVEVFEDALAAMKKEHNFTPSPDQRKKLRNRLAVAFHGAVQNRTILPSGKGGDRLYRLPKRKLSDRHASKAV